MQNTVFNEDHNPSNCGQALVGEMAKEVGLAREKMGWCHNSVVKEQLVIITYT